jgi:UDP-N-acetylmuramyl pentapeptide synthase
MTDPVYTVSEIASICCGTVHSVTGANTVIHDLLIDSRRLIHPEHCLFVALVSDRNNGHKFIEELYGKGVRNFMVSELPAKEELNIEHRISNIECRTADENIAQQNASPTFILVPDTLAALQALGAYHRRQFDIPVIGITGSNGKTIVKEWLFQLLSRDFRIIRSPKSYNSQIGVPLSVWKMAPEHNLAIFEAGISRPGEMEHLASVISPTIGIFTNVGHSHDEYFENQRQKVEEKLKLFSGAQLLIFCADYTMITDCLQGRRREKQDRFCLQ